MHGVGSLGCGHWDQGDEATTSLDVDDGLRAELRDQVIVHVATGTRQDRARLVAVRFVEASGAVPPRGRRSRVAPPRRRPAVSLSEAIRDVSLVAVVAASPLGP